MIGIEPITSSMCGKTARGRSTDTGSIGPENASPSEENRRSSAASPMENSSYERIDHTAYMIGRNRMVQHRKQRPLTPLLSMDGAHKERYPHFREGIFSSSVVKS
jgi:hypothetical protein